MIRDLVNKLFEENITEAEVVKIDNELENNVDKLLKLPASVVIKAINTILDKLSYSYTLFNLNDAFFDFIIDVSCYALTDKQLSYCKKLNKIQKEFNKIVYISDVSLILADEYYRRNDNKNAYKYYYDNFYLNEFDTSKNEYFHRYINFIKLNDEFNGKNDSINKFKSFIDNGIKSNANDLEFVYTLNYYLNNYEYVEKYYKYAYKIAKALVTVIQSKQSKSWSDSDEERALLETLFIKFGQFIKKGTFKQCLDLTNEIYLEIRRSDCTRYYHACQKYYCDAILKFAPKREEFKFFTDYIYCNKLRVEKLYFKTSPDYDNLLNNTYTLINEKGNEFNFICEYCNKEYNSYTFKPVFNEGLGLSLFLKLVEDDKGNKYLKSEY